MAPVLGVGQSIILALCAGTRVESAVATTRSRGPDDGVDIFTASRLVSTGSAGAGGARVAVAADGAGAGDAPGEHSSRLRKESSYQPEHNDGATHAASDPDRIETSWSGDGDGSNSMHHGTSNTDYDILVEDPVADNRNDDVEAARNVAVDTHPGVSGYNKLDASHAQQPIKTEVEDLVADNTHDGDNDAARKIKIPVEIAAEAGAEETCGEGEYRKACGKGEDCCNNACGVTCAPKGQPCPQVTCGGLTREGGRSPEVRYAYSTTQDRNPVIKPMNTGPG